MEIKKQTHLSGELTVPGDKSISTVRLCSVLLHRVRQKSHIFWKEQTVFLLSPVSRRWELILSEMLQKFWCMEKAFMAERASEILDVGNSGTTTRLISGILAGQAFTSELNGDASIQSRPMKRIMTPLLSMGADIVSLKDNGCAPLRITGNLCMPLIISLPVLPHR